MLEVLAGLVVLVAVVLVGVVLPVAQGQQTQAVVVVVETAVLELAEAVMAAQAS